MEQLKAELAEAEDDMEDTVYQHEIEMKQYGYDRLEEEADTALDNMLHALKTNTELQSAVIDDMLNKVTASYEGAYDKIQQIIKDTGLMVSDAFDKYLNAGSSFGNGSIGDFIGDSSITGADNSHINAGDGVGGSDVDNIINNVANSNDSSNDASTTNGDSIIAKSVKLDKTSIVLGIGTTERINVTVTPSNATNKDLVCRVSNEKIIETKVKTTYVGVKGKAVGTSIVYIRANSPNCKEQQCNITVLKNYSQNKKELDAYLSSTGQTLTDSQKNQILINSDDMSSLGVGGSAVVDLAKKQLIQQWYNGLKSYSGSIPSSTSALAKHFMQHGKIANRNDFQELANILGIKTPGANNYESWGSALKNSILNEVKKYNIRYSKGGIVDLGKYIPIEEINQSVQSKGEWGLAGVRRKELILNENLSYLLQKGLPESIDIIKDFNNKANYLGSNSIEYQDNSTSNINISIDKINSQNDIYKLANEIDKILTAKHVRDMKKIRG